MDASRVSMGCVYSIVAYGARADDVKATLESGLDEVDRIDRLASLYRAESALSRLNAEAAQGPVRVDPELFDLLAASMAFSEETGGAFDVTVGPLLEAWGFIADEGHVPAGPVLARARQRVGYRHVLLDRDARTVRFDRPGVQIDLGGIAKGYAVDRAVRLLAAHGIAAALVSAGGSTIRALGAPPGMAGWDVEVQDPIDRRKVAATRALRDRALSVSGSSERFFEADGVKYSHIMDPRSGRPSSAVLAVVVTGDSGIATDALSTALFVAGEARGRAILARHPWAEALFFLPAGPRAWKLVQTRPGTGG